MQKQRAAVFLFFVSVLAPTLQGCAVKRWLFEPRPSYVIVPQPTPESPPPQSAVSAPNDAPDSLQWDFARRADQEQTAEPPQAEQPMAKATPPLSSPSAPPSQAGSTGPRDWVPGLSDGKGESEDNPQYVTEADLLRVG